MLDLIAIHFFGSDKKNLCIFFYGRMLNEERRFLMKAKMRYFISCFLLAAVLASSVIITECACRKKKTIEQI